MLKKTKVLKLKEALTMNREDALEKLVPTPENIRALKGIFLNWHNYSLLLDTSSADKRVVPVAGTFFAVSQINMALKSVPKKKRDMFFKHYVEGVSQSELARNRKPTPVSQALVQWEIATAMEQILSFLAEILVEE